MKHQLDSAPPLTWRWTPMHPHAAQARYAWSSSRFCVVPPGRRSGKSEIAKRRVVRAALLAHRKDLQRYYCPHPDPRFFIAAPTVQQVRAIYWEDIIALIPVHLLFGRPNASTLTIKLINGARIQLLGMDRPERAEGRPWNGGVLDEYANMKADAWSAHLRPALADRGGWADFVGVPEGMNHFYDLFKYAEEQEIDAQRQGQPSEWSRHQWTSLDIIPLYRGEAGIREIEQAKSEMDEFLFKQEFEGSFINFTGRAYYNFRDDNKRLLKYDPKLPLVLTLDFNCEPSVGVVLQEQTIDGVQATCVLSEIYIPRGGNVVMVCDRFRRDYPNHREHVLLHGDASGSARGAAKLQGSEWELVRRRLRMLLNPGQLLNKMPNRNPRERDRVNSLNCRCRNMHGQLRLFVDPSRAPNLVKDLEQMALVKGGSGELDKSNSMLSHLCLRGDTLVETKATGLAPISEIPESGMVVGPLGTLVPYERAGRTIEDADIVEVVTCDSSVFCTPWHRWLTTDGWCSAANLVGKTLVQLSCLKHSKSLMDKSFEPTDGAKYRAALASAVKSLAARGEQLGAEVLTVRQVSKCDAYCLWVPREGCFQVKAGSSMYLSANSDSLGYYTSRVFPIKKRYVRTPGRHW